MRRLLWILAFVFCALTRPVAAPEAGLTVSPVVAPASTTPVWVNTHSHAYHFPGRVWYGRTIHGKYLLEAEAIAEGDRAAKNERRPTNDGAAPAPAPEHPPAPEPTPAPLAATVANAFVPTPELTPAASVAPTPVPLEPGEPLSVCLQAIAAQSDPAKLATLGERAANPRLKRILYYLAQARRGGTDPGEVIDQAQKMNGSIGTPRAPLVRASLLRNLKICDGLGLLTPGNLQGLRTGQAPTVTRGPYTGQTAEVDHIVPLAVAGEVGNELANLEMLPAGLNRGKGAKVGERQLALAKRFLAAGLISPATMANVQARFVPAGIASYELAEP